MIEPMSFLFYDLETSGVDTRSHRIMQFACMRTNADFELVEEPASFYVRLPIDVLPDPQACEVTGLTPQRVNRLGLPELEAHVEIHRHLAQPRTCALGYNSLRFDDEFVRHGFFRHFIEPYGREWQAGNSRWDLIDLTRATAALRPTGLEWPEEDGLASFRLPALTAANGIEHTGAHDALVDVRATVALAKLLREQQPRLFDYYFGMRSKKSVARMLSIAAPAMCLHVSGMFGRERHCLAPVLPLIAHPHNSNSVVVVDLGVDVDSLIRWDAERIREALFTKGAEIRPPLKEVRLNRCPFVAPLSVLRRQDARRLKVDLTVAESRVHALKSSAGLRDKIRSVYSQRAKEPTGDVDASLYEGFINDADRSRCASVLQGLLRGDGIREMDFEDVRLHTLLWRLRARRDFEALAANEKPVWREEVGSRLTDPSLRGITLQQFRTALTQLPDGSDVRRALETHADEVEAFVR